MAECSQDIFRVSSQTSRDLTAEDQELLDKQDLVNEFKQRKIQAEAQRNWDKFYHRNKDNFFKDRNWSSDDLKLLCQDIDLTKPINYLEAGCGVGNMLFPLMTEYPNFKAFGFDFSKNAVRLLDERAKSLQLSVETDCLDLSSPLIESIFSEQADLATLIFVLSAISPEKQSIVVQNMRKFVKVGGTVVVRDYGVNDYAMIRFGRGSKLGDRLYARQDGTTAFYFKIEELVENFTSTGHFECVSKEYLHRLTINHKKGLKVPRVFVQARFVRLS